MYNYASLLAAEYVVKDLLESMTTAEMIEEDIYRVKTAHQTFYTRVNELTIKESEQLLSNASTVTKRSSLLDRQTLPQDEQYALALAVIESKAENLVRAETLWNKEVIFSYKNKQVRIPLDPDLRAHDYDALCLNKALIEGYSFKEVVGRHFLVTTPNKRLRAVSRYTCNCGDFEKYKDCLHYHAVSAFLKYRDLTSELRQLEFS